MLCVRSLFGIPPRMFPVADQCLLVSGGMGPTASLAIVTEYGEW